jgi:hypothetical protein
MLSHAGITEDPDTGKSHINCCADCRSDFQKGRLLRYALKKCLYCGSLPKELQDLTWVEEMVCAKYRNTAHVTQLYGSTDPKQPLVFHGNTCAHDMNVISTASKLPRSPEDVNGMFSVIFVGPGKFRPESLKNTFRVCKKKFWSFLLWLKSHNRLYMDLDLDPSILNF